jgi:hypothetical protein
MGVRPGPPPPPPVHENNYRNVPLSKFIKFRVSSGSYFWVNIPCAHSCRFIQACTQQQQQHLSNSSSSSMPSHTYSCSMPFALVFSDSRPARNLPFREELCFSGYFIYQFCIIQYTNYFWNTTSVFVHVGPCMFISASADARVRMACIL